MLCSITKALVIIMAASEAAKRSPTYGALLVSRPLISILAAKVAQIGGKTA